MCVIVLATRTKALNAVMLLREPGGYALCLVHRTLKPKQAIVVRICKE